jgi:hypothetical protein
VAKIILGGYRTDEVKDADIYGAHLVEVLAAYPFEVMMAVADPNSGLPGKLKWLPTIAEIKAECEHHFEPIARKQRRDKELAEQLAERQKREAELASGKPADPPQGRIVTYGEALQINPGVRPIGVFETEHMGAKRIVPYRG